MTPWPGERPSRQRSGPEGSFETRRRFCPARPPLRSIFQPDLFGCGVGRGGWRQEAPPAGTLCASRRGGSIQGEARHERRPAPPGGSGFMEDRRGRPGERIAPPTTAGPPFSAGSTTFLSPPKQRDTLLPPDPCLSGERRDRSPLDSRGTRSGTASSTGSTRLWEASRRFFRRPGVL